MNTVEVLEKARELISDESRWTQGAFSRDRWGLAVNLHSEKASCFCSVGALAKSGALHEKASLLNELPSPILKAFGFRRNIQLVRFNDSGDHASVLAAFDRAIAAAREA